MRNISCALTKRQIRDRSKTVTRRAGWINKRTGEPIVKRGDILRFVEKCQGLKKGEQMTPIAVVRVLGVRREPLGAIRIEGNRGTSAEGFPEMTRSEFVRFFLETHRALKSENDLVTRIEFEYVTLRAGDRVRLRQTGEDLVVAYERDGLISWLGWPDGEARVTDVDVVSLATDERHADTVAMFHGSTSRRARIVRELYAGSLTAEATA